MIVLATNGNFGDALMMMPTIAALAHIENSVDLVHNCNIFDEFPIPDVHQWAAAEIGSHPAQVLAVRSIENKHPATAVFQSAGFQESDEFVFEPWITPKDESVETYDYLLAPFTRDQALRGWDFAKWNALASALGERDPNATIGVLGAESDPYERVRTGDWLAGCSWNRVANYMKRAHRAVVTIDSAASRLAHAVGVTNHVLILSDVVPRIWGTWPGAKTIYGRIGDVSVGDVLAAVIDTEERL